MKLNDRFAALDLGQRFCKDNKFRHKHYYIVSNVKKKKKNGVLCLAHGHLGCAPEPSAPKKVKSLRYYVK